MVSNQNVLVIGGNAVKMAAVTTTKIKDPMMRLYAHQGQELLPTTCTGFGGNGAQKRLDQDLYPRKRSPNFRISIVALTSDRNGTLRMSEADL